MKLKRPLYGPDHPSGPTRGKDVVAVKRGLWRHPAIEFARPAAGFDDVYNRKTARAISRLQRLVGIDDTGNMGQPTFDEVWPHIDSRGRGFYTDFMPAQPAIVIARCFPVATSFPVRNFGGVSAHKSRPLGNWQSDEAIDIGCPERSAILAIDDGKIVKISGHDPDQGPVGTLFGQSITIELDAGFEVFYTHQKMHPLTEVGERVVAGEMISWVADFGAVGRWPEHLHIAFSRGNPEDLWDEDRWPRVEPIDPD